MKHLSLVIAVLFLPALKMRAGETVPIDAFKKIDCHVHLRYTGSEIARLANLRGFRVINISTNNFDIAWQEGLARHQRRHIPGTVEHVTAFSMKGFAEPWWSAATIAQLDRSFKEDGSIGVKIWKDVGMLFRTPNGESILIDDARFTPLFEHLEDVGKTLVLHIADPIEFWMAPDEIEAPGRRRIVENHGLWVMHGKPDTPSHADLIAARNEVLKRHPKLKVVGVHLGSLEHDLKALGECLDTYPNFAIDTAARMPDLLRHGRSTMREFIVKYQDRIIYGTDMPVKPQHKGEKSSEALDGRWQRDWNILASDKTVEVKSNLGDFSFRGLKLPEPILRKLYHDNALAWFPDLEPSR